MEGDRLWETDSGKDVEEDRLRERDGERENEGERFKQTSQTHLVVSPAGAEAPTTSSSLSTASPPPPAQQNGRTAWRGRVAH